MVEYFVFSFSCAFILFILLCLETYTVRARNRSHGL